MTRKKQNMTIDPSVHPSRKPDHSWTMNPESMRSLVFSSKMRWFFTRRSHQGALPATKLASGKIANRERKKKRDMTRTKSRKEENQHTSAPPRYFWTETPPIYEGGSDIALVYSYCAHVREHISLGLRDGPAPP